MDGLIPALVPHVAPRTVKVLGEELLGAAEVTGQVKEFGMVTELLEDVDRLEWLRVLPAKQRLDLWGGDKKPVEGELQ